MTFPKKIKAVIFDMDGLLINSEVLWGETDTILLKKRGFKPTKELFLRRLGTGSHGTLEIYFEEFGFKEDLELLTKERLGIFYDLLWKKLQLMEGSEELIKNLYNNKITLAIATSGHTPEVLLEIVKKLRLDSYFSVLVSGYQVSKHKPAPDIFLYAGKELGIESTKCLVFEDAPNGILAAKSAGMMAWGVSQNSVAQEGLRKAGADRVFSSLSEITVL